MICLKKEALSFYMEKPVVPWEIKWKGHFFKKEKNSFKASPLFPFLPQSENNCTICVITLLPCSLMKYVVCCENLFFPTNRKRPGVPNVFYTRLVRSTIQRNKKKISLVLTKLLLTQIGLNLTLVFKSYTEKST